MHFIRELIENNQNSDPLKNLPHIHRHFTRYSKGTFNGPAISIKISNSYINLNSSFEYEDFLAWLVANSLSDNNSTFIITGSIISSENFTDKLNSLGLNWNITESSNQVKNYKCILTPRDNIKITKNELLNLIETLNKCCYLLLSFKAGDKNQYSLKTAKNPPRPKTNGDNLNEDDFSKELKFSIAKIPNLPKSLDIIINEILPDFKQKLPKSLKTIEIYNIYEIKNIILPETRIKNSYLIRLMALREGVLIRKAIINNIEYQNKFNFKI